ncbi:hypothetical protein N7536_004049 [Penicillium majusculum]|nr:hypothetical protein N7536_004049 [Penicillium majusculum]
MVTYCGVDWHDGAHQECKYLVKCLLDRGSDIESRDSLGRTVLHQAVFQHCDGTIKPLLETGANTEARDAFDQTPLHMAVSNNRSRALSLLLQHGADPNCKDYTGEAPLHRAIRKAGNKSVEDLLKGERTDVDLTNHEGETLLHLAIRYAELPEPGSTGEGLRNMRRAVQMLRRAGADSNRTNKTGDIPLDLSRRRGLESFVHLLLSEISKVDMNSDSSSTSTDSS